MGQLKTVNGVSVHCDPEKVQNANKVRYMFSILVLHSVQRNPWQQNMHPCCFLCYPGSPYWSWSANYQRATITSSYWSYWVLNSLVRPRKAEVPLTLRFLSASPAALWHDCWSETPTCVPQTPEPFVWLSWFRQTWGYHGNRVLLWS